MLKVVLYAYAHGIVSSRDIEAACRQNVVMMALSADSRPHFTTIAQFIRELGPDTLKLFVDVLLYCDELNLIGKEMFAVDGCKLPSNASKEWSDSREGFEKRRAKFKETIERLLKKHRDNDGDGPTPGSRRLEEKAIENLEAKAAKLDKWLKENPQDKKGASGKPVKSSITDPDSAKMASGHGVIQGYNALAVVDGKHQVIVGAAAFGQSHEAALLGPMLDQVESNFEALGQTGVSQNAKLVADSGFHSNDSVQLLADRGIDGYVPDNQFRKRNAAFQTAGRHRNLKALIGRDRPGAKFFRAKDFVFDPKTGKLICPAGKELYRGGRIRTRNGFHGFAFKAKKTDCRVCELRARCLRSAASEQRQVAKFVGRDTASAVPTAARRMIEKIDSEAGRFLYSMRMGIVEPVFANIRHMLGLDRFTLRGRVKVNAQWTLFAMVHNLGKIRRYGWAGAG